MSRTTRSKYYPSTPKRSQRRREASTSKKSRFFDALDRSGGRKSFRTLAKEYAPSLTTAHRWKTQRQHIGSPSYHRTRRLSEKLGRRPIVTKDVCQMLIDPRKNPIRDQTYEAQISFHNLGVKKHAVLKGLKKHTKRGQRYKQAYIQKKISAKNLRIRTSYGEEHQGKTIDNFWSHILYTDEAHIDPSAIGVGFILREEGSRYETENIQERGDLKGVKLHIAGWVNLYEKCDKLEFYHDEETRTERPNRRPKPRKTMY